MVNAIHTSSPKRLKNTILIVTDSADEILDLREFLEEKTFDVIVSNFDGKTMHNIPSSAPEAVLCWLSQHGKSSEKVVNILRHKYAPMHFPIIGVLDRKEQNVSVFDTVIFTPAHPVQIANRVNSMVRLNLMQTEIALRIDTLKSEFDVDYDISEFAFEDPLRVLFIGKATPEFMVVVNALQNKNVEVVAAFTSFSAFDFLHEHAFDAVVMNALTSNEPSLTISETMRRNSRLYHVPTLLLINDAFKDHDLAYEKGAVDLISANCSETEISGRIMELANFHRIHRKLKSEFRQIGSDLSRDKDSKTYSAKFFKSHLSLSTNHYLEQGFPLSVITVLIEEPKELKLKPEVFTKACNKIGEMIQNMVRMQDTVGRLGTDFYAITFPNEDQNTIKTVIKRIMDVINETVFDSSDANKPNFTLSVKANADGIEDQAHWDIFVSYILGLTEQQNFSARKTIQNYQQKPEERRESLAS